MNIGETVKARVHDTLTNIPTPTRPLPFAKHLLRNRHSQLQPVILNK